MPKNKKTQKEREEENLKNQLKTLNERLHLIPEAIRKVDVGERVRAGGLRNSVVEESLADGRILLLSYDSQEEGNLRMKQYVTWLEILHTPQSEIKFSKRDTMNIQFSQRTINDLLSKAYHFGIDFNPNYQRDYVWGKKDKEKLIESIFDNIEIGKFVFVRYGEEKFKEVNYNYSFEILDGKQRTRAILDFYESRFKYKGFYFHELSMRDQLHFTDYSINVTEVKELSEEEALRYFIKLNTTGKSMSKKHLVELNKRLEEIEKNKI